MDLKHSQQAFSIESQDEGLEQRYTIGTLLMLCWTINTLFGKTALAVWIGYRNRTVVLNLSNGVKPNETFQRLEELLCINLTY